MPRSQTIWVPLWLAAMSAFSWVLLLPGLALLFTCAYVCTAIYACWKQQLNGTWTFFGIPIVLLMPTLYRYFGYLFENGYRD